MLANIWIPKTPDDFVFLHAPIQSVSRNAEREARANFKGMKFEELFISTLPKGSVIFVTLTPATQNTILTISHALGHPDIIQNPKLLFEASHALTVKGMVNYRCY